MSDPAQDPTWLDRVIKPVMVISGLLTCTMFYAAVAPQTALQNTFGQTLEGPVAEIVVRNWGALIGMIGLMLIAAAFRPPLRRMVLLVAVAGKAFFIALVLSYLGPELPQGAVVTVSVDGLMVVLFSAWLVGSRA